MIKNLYINKLIFAVIIALVLSVACKQAMAELVQLNWTSPAGATGREDNTELLRSDIKEFRIYYGTSSGNYVSTISVTDNAATTYIWDLPVGSSYFAAMTTVDVDGRESKFSNEKQLTLDAPPPVVTPPKSPVITEFRKHNP